MKKITETQFKNNLSSILTQVANSYAPIIITRRIGAPVVVLSLKGYEAIEALIHAMEDPIKYSRLLKDIEKQHLI